LLSSSGRLLAKDPTSKLVPDAKGILVPTLPTERHKECSFLELILYVTFQIFVSLTHLSELEHSCMVSSEQEHLLELVVSDSLHEVIHWVRRIRFFFQNV
jgi:hypothetical protein